MPGRLVHTNEVLVLLGDNWFTERSAKQACEIIDRRLTGIDHQIETLHKQKDLLVPRVKFTSELKDISQDKGEMVEIREDYDAAKEKTWREKHRLNVKEHRRQEKERKSKTRSDEIKSNVEQSQPVTDEELLARLDHLEIIEAERKELHRIPDPEVRLTEASGPAVTSVPDRWKSVKWADEEDDRRTEQEDVTLDSEEEEEEGEEEEEEEEEGERPTCITFTHTIYPSYQDSVNEPASSTVTSTDVPDVRPSVVVSPADIYKMFAVPAHSKSILKPSNMAEAKPGPMGERTTEKVMVNEKAAVLQAFSGSIVERSHPHKDPVTTATQPPLTDNSASTSQPQKRVSKFKAERQKQQSGAKR